MTEIVDRPLWEDDGIVADRVRSTLGPLLKRLDQPHAHVMSSRGTVTLHGDVSNQMAKAAVESAAARVFGVTNVVSHLHVGLLPGDSAPSNGHRAERSPLLQHLERVARDCGFLSDAEQRFVLQGVLGVFVARLPETMRRRLLDHLPHDVRSIATPRRFLDSAAGSVMTQHDFVQIAAMTALIDRGSAQRLLHQALPELRRHVPDDAAAIGGLLPPDIRIMWGREDVLPAKRRNRRRPDAASDFLARPVTDVMTSDMVTARPDTSVFEAFELMARTHVHHLPVVRADGHCVALVDAVSVAERLPEAWVTRGAVALHRAGTVGPLSLLPDDSIGKAARLMHAAGIDACCVVDVHERLIGLITARDLIAALAGASTDG